MKMKPTNGNAKANLIVLNLVFCILIVFIYSCGSGGGSGSDGSSGMGSIAFELEIPDTGPSAQRQSPAADINCVDNNVDTIVAEVVDENDEFLAEGGPFDCEDGQGNISDVEAGNNRKAKVFANDSNGVTLFTGTSESFAVVAGQVTDAGLITLLPVNAGLIGKFIGTGSGRDVNAPWTGLFNADFDGLGGGSFQDIATSDNILEDDTLTYDLNVDGSLTATIISTGTVFDGILNADNNILAVVDTDDSDQFIEMDVIIKISTGLSDAILNGEYIGVRSSSNPATALTTTTFDGNGNGTFDFLAASDQVFYSGTFTYSVASDGVVTISGAGDVASEGIVSGDGSVVTLVDTKFRGGNRDIDHTVLIKTSSGLSNASLSGDYVAVNTGVEAGFGGVTARTSIFSDGAGNMRFDTLSSSSGRFDTFNATYNVDPDGRFKINLPNQEILEGIVNRKGDIFNFVNTDISDKSTEMGVAIRETE